MHNFFESDDVLHWFLLKFAFFFWHFETSIVEDEARLFTAEAWIIR